MYSSQYPHNSLAVISRRKGGIFQHIGVLLPNGYVAHCALGRGEHISSVEEFAAGQDVTIVRIVTPDKFALTLQRIAEAMQSPKAYDAMTNNCEVFANRVTGENAASPQLQGVVASIALIALIGWAAR